MDQGYAGPYTVDGQTVTIAFELASSAAANTIIGLPFLRSTKATILLDDDTTSAVVLTLIGESLPMVYHPPLMADVAPTSGTENGAAYTVTKKEGPPSTEKKQVAKQQTPVFLPAEQADPTNQSKLYHSWAQHARVD